MTRSHWLAGVCALPPLLLFAATLTVAVGERAGLAPFGGMRPANAAEAAGLGHSGELLRFLWRDSDPHAVYRVDSAIISSSVQWATPLEAAIWSRRVEMIQLLDREGFLPDVSTRRDLACLASDLRVDDIVEYLAPDGATWCTPDAAVEAVLARTRERTE